MLGCFLEVEIKCASGFISEHNFIFIGKTDNIDECYVITDVPNINNFKGKVIGLINETPIISNLILSKKELYNIFSKKYKDNINLILCELTYEDLLFDIKRSGIKSFDKLMIHSSLKSVGKIVGGPEVLIEAFKNVMTEGLLILPTHTWGSIREDGAEFNTSSSESCVGALTNIARKMEGFKRSMHPTHSVCAYGKNKEEYLAYDLNAKTPVSPNGCFGKLKDMGAKILFLGAPLSKNTFIHSVEEFMDVEDRFTEHIYHFISTDGNISKDYYMPRHFSTKSLHISEHYEKLLPTLLRCGVAKKVDIGNSVSYIVDALGCYNIVLEILKKDIHAFDDFRNIDDLV